MLVVSVVVDIIQHRDTIYAAWPCGRQAPEHKPAACMASPKAHMGRNPYAFMSSPSRAPAGMAKSGQSGW
ncbi:hypothetical protein HBI62_009850 [Parastagonospora nodorum]|nr:hypothetical protein HBI62_009850 [Parastagonospora nodorum]KAH5826122.1 hypothetical protein HBI94_070700 [Parastagonospora nodorum]